MDKLAPAEPAGSTTSSFLPSPTSADRASAPASPSLSPRVGAVSPTTKTPLLLNLQGDSKARLYGTTTVAAAPGPASPTSTGAGGGGDEKPTTKAGRKDGIFRLLKLAKGEAKLLGSAVGLLFISSSVTMAVPFSMGKIIDMVTDPAFPVPFDLTLTQVFAGLGGLFVVGAAANTGRVMLIRTAGERMIAKLRTKLFRHLMRQDMVFFDKNRSGDLVSRLSVDT
ncbi:ATP-binding cassette permease mdl1, partial [Spiromyces aspiralis]